jgi:3-oxoacyl-[acyl-carrier protein] reductase
MNLGIEGKTAVVAGSSQGIGKACAKRLAEEGANVALCARNADRLSKTAKQIRDDTDAGVLAVPTDLLEPDDIDEYIFETRERFGQIDIVVANAGGPPVGEFESFDDDQWYHAFELNFLSNVRLARSTIPSMAERGWGRVTFVTSIAVKQPLDGFILSNSVRLGVEGLSKSLSNRYAGRGVNVNCALPGYTRTERLDEIPDDELDAIAASIPKERIGKPAEFADAVAFLSSERASYITGESVLVDGGFVRSVF